jgi:hypothetical protein
MKYCLKIEFDTLEELQAYTENRIKDTPPVIIKKEKKPDDKRGQNIKNLHKLAKEFKALHPEVPYRECLFHIGEKRRLLSTKPEVS